jgi:hypothetical protein
MTLKQYIEEQMRYFAKAAQEAKVDTEKHNKFLGRYEAYVDILLACPDDILRKKVDEVW